MGRLDNFDEKNPRDVAAALGVLFELAADPPLPDPVEPFGDMSPKGYTIGSLAYGLTLVLKNSPAITDLATKASVKAILTGKADKTVLEAVVKTSLVIGIALGRLPHMEREALQTAYDKALADMPSKWNGSDWDE